jgi:protein-tyrosine phosphatase
MRHIPFERLHNFRDLGGYRSADGRTVRWRMLYRSDSLGKLAGDDWERFLELDIRTVIDLRYPFEIAARGRAPEHDLLSYHNLSIEHRPYDQSILGADVDISRYLADRYAEVALDGVAEIREVLQLIATAGSPIVFHCASGKDRTGLIAALVLSLLDVPEEDILADFALTGLATDRLVADYLAAPHRSAVPGAPPRTHGEALADEGRQLWPGWGQAPAEIMRLFLADLAERHGSVYGYVVEAVGVSPELIAQLRDELLETGAEQR